MKHAKRGLAFGIGLILAVALAGLLRPSRSSLIGATGQPLRRAGSGFASGSAASLSRPDPATQGRVVQNYGKLPLAFESNVGQVGGQTDAGVRFLSRGAGYTLFLTGDEAVLALRGASRKSKVKGRKRRLPVVSGQLQRDTTGNGPRATDSILAMKLVGANPKANVTGTDELPGKSNYFIGSDPKKWRTKVPTYADVKYEGVYPGVDLVYYGNQGQLEYDFVVAPGADPKAITLNVGTGLAPPTVAAVSDRRPAMRTSPLQQRAQQGRRGNPLRIDRNGDLVMKISGGEVRFHQPVVYQPDAVAPVSSPATALGTAPLQNTRHSSLVDGHYRLAGHQVTFSLGSYDRTKPLVIDPALSYSTYLGGSGGDQGYGIAVDASGDAYVTGGTTSTDFPTTPGAFQPAYRGNADAFVTKLNPAGSALVYSTYLGGSGDETGKGIAVDTTGDAYVIGQTGSTDFPTTPGAFQPAYGGNLDAFVTELNPTGSALVYSTYVGGNGNEQGFGINVDALGDAYVTGGTGSANFPITPGTFQGSCGGGCISGEDAFMTELNSTGSALVYSTYLGGSSTDIGQGIALDTSGNVYATGYTSSTDFPTTPGAFQTALRGASDAFLTKLNPTGSALVYSTYLGGSSSDFAQGVAVDTSGNAYVTGYTSSSDFPTTPGAFQTTCSNCANDHDFVTKVDPTGSTLVYSTYLGGSGTDFGYGIAFDASGDAYVTGGTTSFDFPTTPGAFQTRNAGSYDASVTELNIAGSALLYSTDLGSSLIDNGFAIAVDASGNAYVTGGTQFTNFPTTPGAFQTSCSGGANCQNGEAFVAKFVPGDQVWPLSLNFGSQAVGTSSAPQTTTLSNSGTTALSITSIAITGTNSSDYTETNTCGTSLSAGASCTISVTFAPTAPGTRTAAVSITDNAANSPQTVSLTGVGTQPAVTLSPTSLSFPTQLIFTTSAAKTVTLTNSGTGTLTVTSVAVTGNFSETNTCGTSVAPGASCTITVKFTPKTKGTLTGTLSVTDNAPGIPQKVSLTGTGTYVQLVPASLNFGTQPVGTKSLPRKITLTNKGSVAVSISKISITGTNSGDFAETNTCGGSVAGGASCFITVTFTPSAKGQRTASVSVNDNGGGSPQAVALSGTGT